jgi:hypothetical protein
MLYRSKTLRVLCPVIVIATRSEMPTLTIFLIALRLRSWKRKPDLPADAHLFAGGVLLLMDCDQSPIGAMKRHALPEGVLFAREGVGTVRKPVAAPAFRRCRNASSQLDELRIGLVTEGCEEVLANL